MEKSRGYPLKCLFKKKDKIKKKTEIKNVIYSGENDKSHYIDYFYKKSKKSRMAIVLNRSIKKANKRNKIKRRIREIYRKREKKIPIELIIKVKKNVTNKEYKELNIEICTKIENIERKRDKSE